MAFADCLASAVEQKIISRAEARELQERYERRLADAGGVGSVAKAGLEADLRAEAIEQARRLHLTEAAKGRVDAQVQGYRTLDGKADVFEATLSLFEHFGFGGNNTVSIRGRTEAIVSLAHADLADALRAFRRTGLAGRRMNRPLADDVVRELKGEATGSAEAMGMARAVTDVFEGLRQRFNDAGGQIAKLDGWGLPQSHDAASIVALGRSGRARKADMAVAKERWMSFIKPLLDPARMRDPLTGEALSPGRLDGVLSASFDNIVTNGWANRKPAMQRFGAGALASQRQEHRFLVFKDADSWLAYDRQFGKGDPVVAIFDHVNGMARDIAAMETLGPNPGAMVEYLKQVNAAELAKHRTGKPSLYREGTIAQEAVGGSENYLMRRIQQVYDYQRGRETVSQFVADGFGSVRNYLTSAKLGGAAVTAAVTDPFIDALSRRVAGLPVWPAFTAIFQTMTKGATREEVVRAGFMVDDFLHVLRDEARYTSIAAGASENSKWLADRTMQWSMLAPITQGRRHLYARDWMATLADQSRKAWDDVPAPLRERLASYGIEAKDWAKLREIEPYRAVEGAAGLLRPVDIAKVDRGLAEALLGVIHGEMERAVPTGTLRTRSLLLQGVQRGSVPGEMLEGMLQFKSFGLSFTALQMQALQIELSRGGTRLASYAGGMLLSLTIGGALAIQLGNLTQGKGFEELNGKFILAAIQRGGGFGLFGDFLFSDMNRFGNSFMETIQGPTMNLVGDLGKFGVGGLQALATGDTKNLGREGTRLLRQYSPVLSSLWYGRAAYNRLLLDQMQYLADPDAHQNFRNQVRRFERERGGEFWWAPGSSVAR